MWLLQSIYQNKKDQVRFQCSTIFDCYLVLINEFNFELWLQSFINIYYIANHKVLNSLRVSFISSGIVMITMMVGSCYRYSSIAHISYWTLSINESRHLRTIMNLKYQCCCSAFVFESYAIYSTTIDFFALTTQTSMY